MTLDDRFKLKPKTSVIQINENGFWGWIGCICQVDEIKSWGVQAWVQIPMSGSAYIRLNWDQFEYIGDAILTLNENEKA